MINTQRYLTIAAIAVCLSLTQSAHAVITTDDFEIDISAYEAALFGGGGHHLCGSAFTELLSHTTPFVQLTNTSNTTFDQIMVTIGDSDFHFTSFNGVSGADAIYANAGLMSDVTSISSSVSSLGNGSLVDGDKLTVNFDGGLAPGETASFQLALAADDPLDSPSGFVDYRDVFLTPGSQAEFMVVGMLGLPDEMVSPAVSFGIQPNVQTNQSIGFARSAGVAAPISVFEINGPAATIPEPATLALVLVGGLLGSARIRVA